MITIDVIHGNSFVGNDDRERAESAALKVLAEGGVTVAEAFAEFKRQWADLDDYAGMTGLAALWVRAGEEANFALTEGWANPEGAGCSISA